MGYYKDMMWRKIERRVSTFVKIYYRPFLVLFALNILALVTLLRDNFSFTDDLYRAIYGDAWSGDFNRYASSALNYLLHQSFRLFDISPIPQIVAMGIMATTSMMLVKLLVGEPRSLKKSVWPLLMASLITLSPFMMNAWMYKFDAPCMALAIFVSVLPYTLCWGKIKWAEIRDGNGLVLGKFILRLLVILTCVMVMWMSFQAACGIFLAVGLTLVIKDRIEKRPRNYCQTIVFIGAYLASSVLAYLLVKDGSYYRNITTFAPAEMLGGVMSNLSLILQCMLNSLTVWWGILIAAIVILMMVLVSGRKADWHKGALMLIYLGVILVVAIGPYLALEEFPVNGRSMLGGCWALTLFLLLGWSQLVRVKRQRKWLICVPVVVLLYGFMTFAWSFGNALASQYEHDTMRVTMITQDLAEIYPTAEDFSERAFRITGSVGLSAVMTEHFRVFPAAKYVFFIAQEGVNSDALGHYRLFDYSDINTDWVTDWFDADYDCGTGEYETLRENYYYTIRESVEEIKGKNLVCIDLSEEARSSYYDAIRPIFSPILSK